MGKGSYHGGSTVIGRNSGWFTNTGKRPKHKPIKMTQVVKEAAKGAKAAAANVAFIDSIQGLPSTITLGPPVKRRGKKGKKAKRPEKPKNG